MITQIPTSFMNRVLVKSFLSRMKDMAGGIYALRRNLFTDE